MMMPSSSPQSGYGENKGMLIYLLTTNFVFKKMITIKIGRAKYFKKILDK